LRFTAFLNLKGRSMQEGPGYALASVLVIPLAIALSSWAGWNPWLTVVMMLSAGTPVMYGAICKVCNLLSPPEPPREPQQEPKKQP
jgi:predicted MFS family arabinose efflux permease